MILHWQRWGVDGEEISWAGECPWTGTPCFGTSDGGFFVPPQTPAAPAPLISGAVNGVAFSGDCLALSTPEEVAVYACESKDPLSLRRISVPFSGGAHNIAPLAQGGFVATLADDGLLMLNVDPMHKVTAQFARHTRSLYCYHIAPLTRSTAHELFACAACENGLLAIKVDNQRKVSGVPHDFGTHDITDVSRLNDSHYPLGAVCLSRSGRAFIVPNVLSNEPPIEIRLQEMTGTGYSVIAEKGHLFVLTDQQLVAFPNAIARIAAHAPLDPSLIVSTGASEMFLIGAHLVLLSDGDAHFVEIAELVGEPATNGIVIDGGIAEGGVAVRAMTLPTSSPFGSIGGGVETPLLDSVPA